MFSEYINWEMKKAQLKALVSSIYVLVTCIPHF